MLLTTLLSWDRLKDFKHIIVSGPQRSGTTICAHIIHAQLRKSGYTYVDENDFGVYDRVHFSQYLGSEAQKSVLQAPAMSRWLHEFSADTTLIIFMIRALSAIHQSEKRINWHDPVQEELYADINPKHLPIAEIKYDFWSTIQRPSIQHAVELDYDSLRSSDMWVEKSNRTTFLPRQWKP